MHLEFICELMESPIYAVQRELSITAVQDDTTMKIVQDLSSISSNLREPSTRAETSINYSGSEPSNSAVEKEPPQLTIEMLARINANRMAALERKKLREEEERERMRPEEERAIKLHLKNANRPFNANNLIDEFASKFKRSVIIKALQSLVYILFFVFLSSLIENKQI